MRMATAEVSSPRSHCIGRLRRTMSKHPELWGVLAAVVFTLCTKYTQSQPRVLLAPQSHPRRFFASTSPVLDFPYGNIGAVADLLHEQQVLFVMYYAPWCAKSMRTRHEFERAATYMQDQMTFVGINCWYDSGQCRQQNSFASYPVLFAYHTTLDGFRYSGILEADYIVAFLQRLLHPLKRLNNRDEIGTFLSLRDHVVVGFFDFHASPQPPGYDQFYYASMRSIERDIANPVDFGVVTSRALAESFYLKPSQRTILLTRPFNETLRYGDDLNFTSSAIIEWVFSNKANTQQSIKWMVPAGTKSLSLSTEVQNAPSLILFTPYSPVSDINHYFSMFREVALAYHNCDNITRLHNIVESSVYVRLAATMRHLADLDTCRKRNSAANSAGGGKVESDGTRGHPVSVVLTCCSSVVLSGTPASSYNSCDVCTHYSPVHPLSSQHCPLLAIPDLPWGELVSVAPCTELRASYNPTEYISMCCRRPGSHHHHARATSTTAGAPVFSAGRPGILHRDHLRDPFVDGALERQLEARCRGLRLQRTFGWLPVVHTPGVRAGDGAGMVPDDDGHLTGLGCRTNRSVNFLAMNTKHSAKFAEKVGIRLGTPLAPLDTAVLVLDEEREVQYVLEGDVSRDKLVSWLHNLTDGSVRRNLRSRQPERMTCDQSVGEVCLTELSSDTFSSVVMDPDKDVIVLYHAPWCGFCAGFAHIYLTLARYFKSSENIIFARINADSNDLPWELTVDSYPTIHFFPANRKMDSVSFPDHVSKTLPNLLQFVLRYAASNLRLQTGLSICSRACIQNNQVKTARRLQELHAETHLLQRRAALVGRRLGAAERALPPARRPAYLPALREYAHGLQRRVRRKQLQLRSARDLHQALLSSQGVFIDKHKLTAILRTHHQLQVALREVDQTPGGATVSGTPTGQTGKVTGKVGAASISGEFQHKDRDEL